MQRVLVTGANGMLGTDVCDALSKAGIQPIRTARGGTDHNLDIADAAAASSLLADLEPDAVINCAAYTQVDRAETERDEAFRVNAEGPRALAAACASLDIPLCHISTDFVFDGAKGGPYIETDTPNPLSVYGASKLAGEQAVREVCHKHWIVRTSWLYGLHGKCFPDTILKAAATRPELAVVADQRGTPTFTEDLAAALVRLIQLPCYGTYHLANSADNGSTTWYDLARVALELAGSKTPVRPISTNEWPTPARRPANSALASVERDRIGLAPLRIWQDALSDYIRAIVAK